MKKRLLCLFLAILLLSFCVLTGCSNNNTTNPTTNPTAKEETQMPTTPAPQEETKPAVKNDGVLNLLMVGSSYCYYYVEELYDLLMENPPEGITEVNVYNLYYSGCKITWHHNWWKEGKANYDFFRVDATGRKKVEGFDKWSLDQALVMADWDFISLQGTPQGQYYYSTDPNLIATDTYKLAEPVLDHFHEMFPNAKLLWHGTWAKEIGRIDTDGHIYIPEEIPVINASMAQVCRYLCENISKNNPYDLTMVPTGLAWTKTRQANETENLLPYGGLCARLGKNSFGDNREHSGDGTHDGDIGGGQFLNACVWYEIITGNDCREVQYIPTYIHNGITYTVDGVFRTMLQNAAHEAVAENK